MIKKSQYRIKQKIFSFPIYIGGYWHFILNYTESETVLDIPHSVLLFLMSQDTYLGISFGTWLTYVEPLVFEMDLKSEKEASYNLHTYLNFYSSLLNIVPLPSVYFKPLR